MIERRGVPVADILAARREIAALAASLMRSGDIAAVSEVLDRMPEPKEQDCDDEMARLLADIRGLTEEESKR